jgi:hypothetical protein
MRLLALLAVFFVSQAFVTLDFASAASSEEEEEDTPTSIADMSKFTQSVVVSTKPENIVHMKAILDANHLWSIEDTFGGVVQIPQPPVGNVYLFIPCEDDECASEVLSVLQDFSFVHFILHHNDEVPFSLFWNEIIHADLENIP